MEGSGGLGEQSRPRCWGGRAACAEGRRRASCSGAAPRGPVTCGSKSSVGQGAGGLSCIPPCSARSRCQNQLPSQTACTSELSLEDTDLLFCCVDMHPESPSCCLLTLAGRGRSYPGHILEKTQPYSGFPWPLLPALAHVSVSSRFSFATCSVVPRHTGPLVLTHVKRLDASEARTALGRQVARGPLVLLHCCCIPLSKAPHRLSLLIYKMSTVAASILQDHCED